MPNYDVYGNVDRYALFYDARTGTQEWYPQEYRNHPLWAQHLREISSEGTPGTLPSSALVPGNTVFPSVGQPGEILPDVPRPAGMHGVGARKTVNPVSINYEIFPATTLYPSDNALTRA